MSLERIVTPAIACSMRRACSWLLLGTGGGLGFAPACHLSESRLAAERKARRKNLSARIIDASAGEFGAMAIVGSMQGSFGVKKSIDETCTRVILPIRLSRLGEHAATQYGVPLLYEPLNRYETNLLNTSGTGGERVAGLDCET